LRKITGPRREEVTEGRRTLHHNLYYSPNIITVTTLRRKRRSRCGQMRNAYHILAGKPEGLEELEKILLK
jgi:hypothetical protein